ncbi:MAG: VCBS repeat-containing protein [Verrucomicrobiota bacterium]|nr:VCBS repeat-containing protein [Verrucomicrobiota bacterium]
MELWIGNSLSGKWVRLRPLLLLILLCRVELAAQEIITRALPEQPTGKKGFTLVTNSGVLFTNVLNLDHSITNSPINNGSGLAFGDVDGDGWCDLYLCGIDSENKLFRNLGDFRFEEITEKAGVAAPGLDATGAVFADIDGDGDVDLLVNSLNRGTTLFINQGNGTFQDQTAASGLSTNIAAMSVALADTDGDGDLDLYVSAYRPIALPDQVPAGFTLGTIGGQRRITKFNGVPVTSPELQGRFSIGPNGGPLEHGQADRYYLNNGGGRFLHVPWNSGAFLDENGEVASIPYDWGLGVLMRDFNGDGAPDIYVCNDSHSPDRFWINNGKGTFRAAAAHVFRQTCLSSMGVDAADINRDGHLDFIVLDMLSRDHQRRLTQLEGNHYPEYRAGDLGFRPQSPRNMLYLNRGDGSYAEIACLAGVEASSWSWTPAFADFDLDGWEDLLVSNGFSRDVRDADANELIKSMQASRKLDPKEQLMLRTNYPDFSTPLVAFRNQGNLRFEEVGKAWGFTIPAISHGLGLADLDNDGDYDLALNNLNAPAHIYRNDFPGARVAIQLKGKSPNNNAIGSRIELRTRDYTNQSEVIAGGKYLSGDQTVRIFAAPSAPFSLVVHWRSGRKTELTNCAANTHYTISEPDTPAVRLPAPPESASLFTNVSGLLSHIHQDAPFDDFARQPFLPRKLSHEGPKVAAADFNRDGLTDLIVPAGKGGRLALLQNVENGRFTNASQLPVSTRDQSAVAILTSTGGSQLLIAQSNDEDGLAAGNAVVRINLSGSLSTNPIPAWNSSVGTMALGDVNRDGSPDLFLGGRSKPGRYPEPASSLLLLQREGDFFPSTEHGNILTNLGLVTASLFTDLNQDGWEDLVVATEWGTIRLFTNRQGRLVERQDATLAGLKGLWTSVAAGDFDGDGSMDIVAGNFGSNTQYESYRVKPLRLYYNDFDGDQRIDPLESYFAPELGKYVPARTLNDYAKFFPRIRERFPTHHAFARAGIEELLAAQGTRAGFLEVNHLKTTLFLNRGGAFVAVDLPQEAQFAPVFDMAAADFNNDKHLDLFLAQNFFAVRAESTRYDAGQGLLLLGNGAGQFRALNAKESGIRLLGEQRGCAVGDFNHDGLPDLAVTQNSAPTALFLNHAKTVSR